MASWPHAMRQFLEANTSFESSTAVELVMKEILCATSVLSAFQIPIQHKILDYNGALKWLHFIHIGVINICKDNIETWDITRSLDYITEVYDIATQNNIWDYCIEETSEISHKYD